MFDGSDAACWPHGSDSHIARDWLYRGVYAQQLARLAAHFPRVSLRVEGCQVVLPD